MTRCRRLGLDCTEQPKRGVKKRTVGTHATPPLSTSVSSEDLSESQGSDSDVHELSRQMSDELTAPFMGPGGALPSFFDHPALAMADCFLRMHSEGRISRNKALTVLRSMALSCLKYNSDTLARSLAAMSQAVGVEWKALVSDQAAVNEAFALTRGVRPQSKTFDVQQLDPYLKDIYTGASAAIALITIDGDKRLFLNDCFTSEFSTPADAIASVFEQLTPLDFLERCGTASRCLAHQ
jgi:hypothetical protein